MDASDSIKQFIPHAPKYGLYVTPGIPDRLLGNALRTYATNASGDSVQALYDATLFGSGRDGALFFPDSLIFRNNRMQPVQEIPYDDITDVRTRRQLLGGRRLVLDVNRGQATVSAEIDFSARASAAEYVERLIRDLLIHGVPARKVGNTVRTDVRMVKKSLQMLVGEGRLTPADYERIVHVLDEDVKAD